MATVYPELDERLTKFIAAQPIFFVATAPCLTASGDGGHVNMSPKGYRDTFAILGPRAVAYLDLTGSGAETIAHLRQNGQITIMFCSFDHETKILRLYRTGSVVLPGTGQREERDVLTQWSERRTPDGLAAYRAEKNSVSIDGLPALG